MMGVPAQPGALFLPPALLRHPWGGRGLRLRRPRAGPRAALSTAGERLAAVRREMAAAGVDALVVPSGDPHGSEYVCARFRRREYLSGFSGSAGTAVVLPGQACLWTDGRYTLQAARQLDSAFWSLRTAADGRELPDWLAQVVPPGGAVAIDPLVVRFQEAARLRRALAAKGVQVVEIEENLVDKVWKEMPPLPTGPLRVHSVEHAGVSVSEKLAGLRDEMREKDVGAILISMLDEVAWVLNIRGDDVPYCPVALAYLLVTRETAQLFIEELKVADGSAVARHLAEANVQVFPYEQVITAVTTLANDGVRIWLDDRSTSVAVCNAAGENSLIESTSLPRRKAIKNQAELEGMKAAHLRDGAALCSFLHWLDNRVTSSPQIPIEEMEAARKLEEFRAAQTGFLTPSFETIAGVGPNGAIIHYAATSSTTRNITKQELFLLDSGGQYVDGTTDVTRSMHFGVPSKYQKKCYTCVLKGHIALDSALFPQGTTGFMLDVLARAPLWSAGLDYRHGTGHGVGASLNVHEGPQSISPRITANRAALEPGMIVSIEPGYYEEGPAGFGIRIENLVFVVEKQTGFGGKKYLGFEKLTFVPLDLGLVDVPLLTAAEEEWIDRYHSQCWDKINNQLSDPARAWLWRKTRPLREQVTTAEDIARKLHSS